jgi:hypothetical protein
MRTRFDALAVGCLAFAAVTACSGAPDADTAGAVDRVRSGMDAQAGAVQAVGTQTAGADAARDAAAKTLGVAAGQVTIDKVEGVQWKDAALGCPAGGQAIPPATTPGTRFVLSAANQHVEVHSDATGRLVVCQDPTQ